MRPVGERLGDLVASTARRFRAAGLADPGLEARLLIAGLFDIDAAGLIAGATRMLDAGEGDRIEAAVVRRLNGEPIYRILGWREFHSLRFRLSPATLEPRPDTEILVDAVVPFLRNAVSMRGSASVLDLGTGTGAIGLSLVAAVPGTVGVGSDLSAEALATANENARVLGLSDRFTGVQSDWFSRIAGRYDAIVSNPPYIRHAEIGGLDIEVREHDPLLALDGGVDGLEPYRHIAAGAAEHLAADGIVAVETGYDQHEDVAAIFAKAGFETVSRLRDLGGRDRVLVFRFSASNG